jgi:hypothetical protein
LRCSIGTNEPTAALNVTRPQLVFRKRRSAVTVIEAVAPRHKPPPGLIVAPARTQQDGRNERQEFPDIAEVGMSTTGTIDYLSGAAAQRLPSDQRL